MKVVLDIQYLDDKGYGDFMFDRYAYGVFFDTGSGRKYFYRGEER